MISFCLTSFEKAGLTWSQNFDVVKENWETKLSLNSALQTSVRQIKFQIPKNLIRPCGSSWLKFLRVTWVTKLTVELRILRLSITTLTQSQHYQKISHNSKILILDPERTWPSRKKRITREFRIPISYLRTWER